MLEADTGSQGLRSRVPNQNANPHGIWSVHVIHVPMDLVKKLGNTLSRHFMRVLRGRQFPDRRLEKRSYKMCKNPHFIIIKAGTLHILALARPSTGVDKGESRTSRTCCRVHHNLPEDFHTGRTV